MNRIYVVHTRNIDGWEITVGMFLDEKRAQQCIESLNAFEKSWAGIHEYTDLDDFLSLIGVKDKEPQP